jgi:hypothetical protein
MLVIALYGFAQSPVEDLLMLSRAIILTNYLRPWNIPRLVEACREVSSATVILIDNSEGSFHPNAGTKTGGTRGTEVRWH